MPEGRTAVMLENITWQVSMESKKINITDIHRHFVENHKTSKGLQVHHLKTNVLKKVNFRNNKTIERIIYCSFTEQYIFVQSGTIKK